MGLALEEADAHVELGRHVDVLVMLGEGPDEGAVVGAHLGEVGVRAITVGGLAIAGGCCDDWELEEEEQKGRDYAGGQERGHCIHRVCISGYMHDFITMVDYLVRVSVLERDTSISLVGKPRISW